ncbi:hypothetical protein L3Q82_021073 [Scortum barcoo]|uniref:Uncharacterized protein n=1 Tax=Scortum barcoo TaxID=214431 RepID=A0ACB8X4Z3_9TELE|nr:hypothetical protein L3Q82_021073 [Scortum barcoo]
MATPRLNLGGHGGGRAGEGWQSPSGGRGRRLNSLGGRRKARQRRRTWRPSGKPEEAPAPLGHWEAQAQSRGTGAELIEELWGCCGWGLGGWTAGCTAGCGLGGLRAPEAGPQAEGQDGRQAGLQTADLTAGSCGRHAAGCRGPPWMAGGDAASQDPLCGAPVEAAEEEELLSGFFVMKSVCLPTTLPTTQQWWALIRDDNDLAYREEVEQLVRWVNNNLILNADKTKEISLMPLLSSWPTNHIWSSQQRWSAAPVFGADTFSSRQVFVLLSVAVGGYGYFIFGSGTKLFVTEPTWRGRAPCCVWSSAMFPPLVQFSWKRQKEDGPLEELPPAEGEQLELSESGCTGTIRVIDQDALNKYKYRCYVQHEGGNVEASEEQGVSQRPSPSPPPSLSTSPQPSSPPSHPPTLPASCPPSPPPPCPAAASFQSQCRVKLLSMLYSVLIVKSLVYCCGLSLLRILRNKGPSTNCTHAD